MQDLYTQTVPTFTKLLGGLKTVLSKMEEHVKEAGLDEKVVLADALAPDMFNFTRQVQIACDQAKGATARLAGIEIPKFEDTETTFAELGGRIDKTLAFVASVDRAAFATAADRQITLPYFPGKFMSGTDYAMEYAVPNFVFHVTIAYALARKNGAKIGKADFMNGLPLRDLAE